ERPLERRVEGGDDAGASADAPALRAGLQLAQVDECRRGSESGFVRRRQGRPGHGRLQNELPALQGEVGVPGAVIRLDLVTPNPRADDAPALDAADEDRGNGVVVLPVGAQKDV